MAKRQINPDNLPGNPIDPTSNASPVSITGRVREVGSSGNTGGFGNELRAISQGIFTTVVVPAVKGVVTDFVTNLIQQLVWGSGSSGPQGNSYSSGRVPRRNYDSYSRPTHNQRGGNRRRPVEMDMNETAFEFQQDAKNILGEMIQTIGEYGFVTVGDYYQIAGITNRQHTAERYGWDRLSPQMVRATGDGWWYIDLPKPTYRG